MCACGLILPDFENLKESESARVDYQLAEDLT